MRWTWMVVLALAAGCDSIDFEQLVKQHPARTRVADEPPGARCPHGGQVVLTGLDLDEDGQLGDDEVTATEYVCSAAPRGALARTRDEAPGEHCPHGGKAVETGVDGDSDGQLGDAEVTATEYVCATAVPDVLVRTRQVPPGERCPRGGQVSHAGRDTNGNGVLEDTEISREVYACTEVDPVLVQLRAVPLNHFHCLRGGAAVDAGPDVDRDGVLDVAERSATAFICTDTSLVLTRQREQPAGSRCPAGGTAVEAGTDVDQDGALGDAEVLTAAYVCQPSRTYDGTYMAQDAADVAALQAVGRVRGSLLIKGTALTEVVLPGLAVVEGALRIESNPALTRVELKGLGFVGTELVISDQPHLETLALGGDGGERLYVQTDLHVQSNPRLASLEGLSTVSPHRSLYLDNNDALQETGAFNAVDQLTGSAVISGNDGLRRLPLPNLQGAGGMEVANNDALTSLEGLDSLRTISGDFYVTDNDALLNLAGPFSLSFVGGRFIVAANDVLQSTAGLGRLGHVGWLDLFDNPVLETVGPLPLLRTVGFMISMTGHPKLVRVEGLDSLQYVARVSLVDNPLLADLRGLGTVSRLDWLEVTRCGALASLAALAALREVSELTVQQNASLSRLDLGALEKVGSAFTVAGNPRLPTCLAQALAASVYTGPAELRLIEGNDDTATCGN